MKKKNYLSGFTLIELLVVVLIIGILAAIAVPQYQVAVMKSRYTELMILGNAIYRSRQAHFLATGSYGTDFTELDLELPGCSMRNSGNKINAIYHCSDKKFSCDIYDSWTHCHMDSDTLYYSILSSTGKRECGALKADNTANQVCKSVGGTKLSNNETTTWYSLK